MHRKLVSMLFIALAASVGLGTGAALAQDPGARSTPPPVLTRDLSELVRTPTAKMAFVPDAAVAAAMRSREVIRTRPVDIDIALLKAVRAEVAASGPRYLRITFFDDAVVPVQIVRTESFGRDGTAYIGVVAGLPHSSAVIVEEDGVVSGNVDMPGSKYQIRNFGGAGHVVQHIDGRAYPPEHGTLPIEINAPPLPATRPASRSASTDVLAAADDGSQIDVMVVYTPAARAAQGGTAAITSLVNLGVAVTNTAYADSNVVQRLRLVYSGEVTYTEVDPDTDLTRLQGANDGFMDEVHALRDANGADIVSLWREYSGDCGLGYHMATESSGFAPFAFNIVSRGCAVGNYSFAHEVGHNMGLRHDNFVDAASTTVTPAGSAVASVIGYAHGYVDAGNRFYTIMAYASQCVDAGVNCTRIQRFSNPGLTFDNTANFPGAAIATTGNAATADEHRAMNDTRETTANFRPAVSGVTGLNLTLTSLTASPALVTVGATANLTATVRNTGTVTSSSTTLRYFTVIGGINAELSPCRAFVPALAPGASFGSSCQGYTLSTLGTVPFHAVIDTLPDESLASDNTSAVTTIVVASAVHVLTVTRAGAGTGTVTGTGIECGGDCTEPFAVGTSVTLAASAAAGSAFAGWSGGCTNSSGTCTLTMTAAKSVTATFTVTPPVTYVLTAATTGAGSGAVTGAGIDCGGDCTETYVSGTSVTLTAVPAAGSTFAGWSGDCSNPSGTCTLTMTAAKSVTATFTVTPPPTTYVLTVAKAGAGSGTVTGTGIECGGDCSETYASGTIVTLIASAAPGNSFSGWSGDCTNTVGTCVLTMSAAKSVTATFNVGAARPAGVNFTDIWWNAAESGQGYNLVQSGNFIFLTFFIYGTNGAPTWYFANLNWNGVDSFVGNLSATTGTFFGVPWVPGNLTRVTVGTASFTPSVVNPYQGTLSYSATNVGATTKAIERQTLTPIALGGDYAGAQSGAITGCADPAGNGTYDDNLRLSVTQAGGTATFAFTYTSFACTLAGTLVAHGSLYAIPDATYTCSNGLNTTASFHQIKATAQGIEGHFSAPAVGGGCAEDAAFSAVLRRGG